MDWKLFATAFTTIFLAEMGDKTQIATLGMAASGSRLAVFLGAASALVATSAIAILAAEFINRLGIPPIWIRRAAGACFLVLGAMYLFSRGEG